MARVHPTAIVEDGARLGSDVTVGAYTLVGRDSVIGDGVTIAAHVTIAGRTTIGPRTSVGVFSVIGSEPQDLSYRGEDTAVEVGADCSIREHVTIHRGTAHGRGVTYVGAKCFLMIASHVAHDCLVGNNVILTNQATLGGHVEIGEYAILGGLAAVQQRCRVGAHAFIGGLSAVTTDIVPFAMALGHRAALAGINVRGLKRRGFDREAIHALRGAYRMFFFTPGARAARIAAIGETYPDVPAVGVLVDFLRATGDRPLALPRERDDEDDDE